MSLNQEQIQKLTDEYNSLNDLLVRFSSELKNQISKMIEDSGIHLAFPVLYRVKTLESALEKIERLDFSKKSLTQFQDLVGLRIVVLFARDIDVISELIGEKFVVVRKYNTMDRLKEDQFGYLSTHIIIKIPTTWSQIPTFSGMSELQAEIQVRTLAQHTWSEASRILQYKNAEAVPSSVLRSVYRLSALLETVDFELERVLNQRDEYKDEITDDNAEKLNVDILENTLDEILPPANKVDDERYSDLLMQLLSFGLDTKQEVANLVAKHLSSVLLDEKKAVSIYSKKVQDGEKAVGFSKERILAGVYYTHTGIVRNMLRKEFGEKYTKPQRLQASDGNQKR